MFLYNEFNHLKPLILIIVNILIYERNAHKNDKLTGPQAEIHTTIISKVNI